jgi:hypothetical protein
VLPELIAAGTPRLVAVLVVEAAKEPAVRVVK